MSRILSNSEDIWSPQRVWAIQCFNLWLIWQKENIYWMCGEHHTVETEAHVLEGCIRTQHILVWGEDPEWVAVIWSGIWPFLPSSCKCDRLFAQPHRNSTAGQRPQEPPRTGTETPPWKPKASTPEEQLACATVTSPPRELRNSY